LGAFCRLSGTRQLPSRTVRLLHTAWHKRVPTSCRCPPVCVQTNKYAPRCILVCLSRMTIRCAMGLLWGDGEHGVGSSGNRQMLHKPTRLVRQAWREELADLRISAGKEMRAPCALSHPACSKMGLSCASSMCFGTCPTNNFMGCSSPSCAPSPLSLMGNAVSTDATGAAPATSEVEKGEEVGVRGVA
jgi:hypothetical protein